MANNLLTPTMITREALRILHTKLSFIGGVNRQYDDRYAQEGARGRQALAVESSSPAIDRAVEPVKVRLVRKVVREVVTVSMDRMVAST